MPPRKPQKAMKKAVKKAKQAVKPNLPRFEASPPPSLGKMMKRRGMKNVMPKAFRKNIRIH